MTDFEINGLVLKLEEEVVSKLTNFKEERKINDTRISFSGFFYIVDLLRGKTLEYKEEFEEEFKLLGVDTYSLFILESKDSKDFLTLMSKTETVIPEFDLGEKDTKLQKTLNDYLDKLDQNKDLNFEETENYYMTLSCERIGYLKKKFIIPTSMHIIKNLNLEMKLHSLPLYCIWKNNIIENIKLLNGYTVICEYPKEFLETRINNISNYSYKTKEEKLSLSSKGFNLKLNVPILEDILSFRSRLNFTLEITLKKMSDCVKFFPDKCEYQDFSRQNFLVKLQSDIDYKLNSFNYIDTTSLFVSGLRCRYENNFNCDIIKNNMNYTFNRSYPESDNSTERFLYTISLRNSLVKEFVVITTDKKGNGIDCLENVSINIPESRFPFEKGNISSDKQLIYPVPLSNLERRVNNLPEGYYKFRTNLDIKNVSKLPEDATFNIRINTSKLGKIDELRDLKVGILTESVSFIKYFKNGDVSNVFVNC